MRLICTDEFLCDLKTILNKDITINETLFDKDNMEIVLKYEEKVQKQITLKINNDNTIIEPDGGMVVFQIPDDIFDIDSTTQQCFFQDFLGVLV